MINKQVLAITSIVAIIVTTAFILSPISQQISFQSQAVASAFHPANPDCESCHIDEWTDWNNSHHSKSMQVANGQSVLGNFNDQKVLINSNSSLFYKKGEEFWVNTEGSDYKIAYTFGVEPLQQYLIEMERGSFQTLPLSWDSRPLEQGGQRWFHIYGDEPITQNDRLHWQQPLQNWNGMCADCHSSGLKRNYDTDSNSFETTWDEINVGCVSCHDPSNNLSALNRANGAWLFTEGSNTAIWSGEKPDHSEIENCAACHSRRTPLTDGFNASDKFLDGFLPASILTPEYFPDGQIRDEDYVWGSFLQSKMYAQGVTCSDCHDPHSLKLKADGNDMCTTCHQATYFDTSNHHKHEQDSTGSQCVNCHMPERTYMGVDDRRDHSFRIPRPDLNHASNSPDACTTCHEDKEPAWAASHIDTWFGSERPPHYGVAMNIASLGAPQGERGLNELLMDETVPVIIKGSAYALLANYPNRNSYNAITEALQSEEPLLKLGAIKAAGFIPIAERSNILLPLLNDEYRAVRVEVVRALSDIDLETIPDRYHQTYEAARDEFLIASAQVSWRGEGQYNLGLFYGAQNELAQAEQQYLNSIEIDPFFAASYINLADHYRSNENETLTAETLTLGLSLMPQDADLNFSKALSLIRQGKAKDALTHLEIAVKNAPDNARYAYVYDIAKNQLSNQN